MQRSVKSRGRADAPAFFVSRSGEVFQRAYRATVSPFAHAGQKEIGF
jgi:hypothetical protein